MPQDIVKQGGDRGIAEVRSQIAEVKPFDFDRVLKTLLLQSNF
jgi:hypothetical protein